MERKDEHKKIEQQAQTFLEYTLLFGIVVALIIGLSPLMKRGIQASVRSVADQMGLQQCAEQTGGKKGKVEYVNTRMQNSKEKTRLERVGGNLTYQYDDVLSIGTEQLVNSGFSSF